METKHYAIGFAIGLLVYLAVIIAIGYAAVHFVIKFW